MAVQRGLLLFFLLQLVPFNARQLVLQFLPSSFLHLAMQSQISVLEGNTQNCYFFLPRGSK